jgi:hypothetical protein
VVGGIHAVRLRLDPARQPTLPKARL